MLKAPYEKSGEKSGIPRWFACGCGVVTAWKILFCVQALKNEFIAVASIV